MRDVGDQLSGFLESLLMQSLRNHPLLIGDLAHQDQVMVVSEPIPSESEDRTVGARPPHDRCAQKRTTKFRDECRWEQRSRRARQIELRQQYMRGRRRVLDALLVVDDEHRRTDVVYAHVRVVIAPRNCVGRCSACSRQREQYVRQRSRRLSMNGITTR